MKENQNSELVAQRNINPVELENKIKQISLSKNYKDKNSKDNNMNRSNNSLDGSVIINGGVKIPSLKKMKKMDILQFKNKTAIENKAKAKSRLKMIPMPQPISPAYQNKPYTAPNRANLGKQYSRKPIRSVNEIKPSYIAKNNYRSPLPSYTREVVREKPTRYTNLY